MILNEIVTVKMVCDGGTMLGAASTAFLAASDSVTNTAILGLVTVLTTTVGAYFAYKAKVLAQESKDISEETHKAVNGQMEAFKELAQTAYRAEGKLEAKAEDKVIAAAEAKGRAEVVAMAPPTVPPAPIFKEPAVPIPLPITIEGNKKL